MWNGKHKAFTMSYDDAVESDVRFLEIINRYGLKCTFNVNSGIIGSEDSWENNGFVVKRLPVEGLKELYEGHEVAVHGCLHLNPADLDKAGLVKEFGEDKTKLEELFGTHMVGMAYPYGVYNDETVAVLEELGLHYGRTVEDSLVFTLQESDRMRFKPTCHHKNQQVMELLDAFIASESEEDSLFYLWGHSYEFDADGNWELLEAICEKIAGHDDVFYGTNKEVFGLA